MFIKINEFTKQMKNAYKGAGLKIGKINDGLVIYSGHWLVWIDEKHVPNKIKAAVVELMGKLPDSKVIYDISKERPEPQVCMSNGIEKILNKRKDKGSKLIETPVILTESSDVRLYQNDNGMICALREEYKNMVDPMAIDYDTGESMPIGPCYSESFGSGLYWYNDFGFVLIMPVNIKNSAVVEALIHIDFGDEKNGQ
jgi:hypothetical protein